MRTMEEQRSKLRSRIKDYEKSGASETKKQTSNHKASDFHIGDTVQVLSMGTRGTITKLPDNKGIAGVQMGIFKFYVADFRPADYPGKYRISKWNKTKIQRQTCRRRSYIRQQIYDILSRTERHGENSR